MTCAAPTGAGAPTIVQICTRHRVRHRVRRSGRQPRERVRRSSLLHCGGGPAIAETPSAARGNVMQQKGTWHPSCSDFPQASLGAHVAAMPRARIQSNPLRPAFYRSKGRTSRLWVSLDHTQYRIYVCQLFRGRGRYSTGHYVRWLAREPARHPSGHPAALQVVCLR